MKEFAYSPVGTPMNDLTVIISAKDYNAETTKTLYNHVKFTDTRDSLTRYVVNPPGAGLTTEWLHKHCQNAMTYPCVHCGSRRVR